MGGPAFLGRGVHHRKIQLVLVRVEPGEQVEDLVQNLVRPLVLAVHLVDHDDGAKAQIERLAGDELGLGHGALGRVDEEQNAVDHGENALHLAAEIGMARRVDDVEPGAAIFHRRAFGENGDAPFALQIARVQGALRHLLVVADGAGLAQQAVHQRGLAVIHMGDDGEVPQIHGAGDSPWEGR